MQKISAFMQHVRKSHSLNVEEVSDHVGMSEQWVRKLEGGKAPLSAYSKSLVLYYVSGWLTETEMLAGMLLLADDLTSPNAGSRSRKGAGRSRRHYQCPPKFTPFLGEVVDRELADMAGVSHSTARLWRIDAGLSPRGKTLGRVGGRPKAEVVELLRTNNDPAAGKILGVSRARVQQFRVTQGIGSLPSRTKKSNECKLKPFGDMLGKMCDGDLALKADVPKEAVAKARRERGLPAYSLLRKKMESVRHLMGEESDTALSRKVGVSPQTVARYRNKWNIPTKHKSFREMAKIDWVEVFKLWKEGWTDQQIADHVGSTAKTIATQRSLKGWVRSKRPSRSKLRAFHSHMYTHTDGEVAKMSGLSIPSVRAYRKRHNISKESGK